MTSIVQVASGKMHLPYPKNTIKCELGVSVSHKVEIFPNFPLHNFTLDTLECIKMMKNSGICIESQGTQAVRKVILFRGSDTTFKNNPIRKEQGKHGVT